MFIKKLSPDLDEALNRENFLEPTPLQKIFFSKINSGKNIITIGDEGSGISTALIISAIHKTKEAFEKAPRAIIAVKDDEAVSAMEETFMKITRFINLRFDALRDSGKIKEQIDWLYEGSDVVVGTVKRLNEVYLQNGLNMNELKMFAIDDCELIFRKHYEQALNHLMNGAEKCQKIICTNDFTPRVQHFVNDFMDFYDIVELQD